MTKKKAGFDTTGRVHHEGKKNENVTAQILNEKNVYPHEVEVRGGTKCLEDAVAGDQKISIKHKAGITNGSFDWANLSSAVKDGLLGNTFDHFLSNMKELRQLPKSLRLDEEFRQKVDGSFKDLCELSLDSFTSDQVIEVLKRGIIERYLGVDVVINDSKIKELYKFAADQHPIFDYITKGYSAVLTTTRAAKSSRMIYFVDQDGNVYDCGLRIRVTSNNGIKAFLGVSTANSNSQVVIKLQQDKVAKLLEEVKAEVYSY